MRKEQLFTKILLDGAINTVFQPIVSLGSGDIIGYEALSRISIPSCEINIEELFQIAHQQDRLWELEKLCRTKALQNASVHPSGSLLFLNVDTDTIHDPEFKAGFTADKLKKYGINANNVVIELTEQSAISDLEGFVSVVCHYQHQGFQIAIDDFGTGYSGLSRVCALSPAYLKLDLGLIRNIHKDAIRQSAVSSTVAFCRQSGIHVIAEGIETEEELRAVIRLGVDFGQGYYLQRPDSAFSEIPSDRKQRIQVLSKHAKLRCRPSVFGRIADLGAPGTTVFQDAPSLPIYEALKKTPELTEVIVLNEEGQVCGILPRRHVFEKFSGEFGYNLSRRLTAGVLMLTEFLAVDEQTSIDKVAELAMQRSPDRVYDSVAVTRNGKYLSMVTVRDLLLTSVRLQLQQATDANPLTGLPGNHEIQRVIEQTFRKSEPWAIIYLDLDNFKAYNDAYGFTNGDLMLKAVADTMQLCAGEGVFLGHVGGDDFVMIADTHEVETLCQDVVREFHHAIEELYSASDWEQGYIISKDRNGFTQKFSIATLSIAVITNRREQPATMDKLSALIACTKKACKQQEGNTILIR